MSADIRCICGAVTTVTIGQFSKCGNRNCGMGLSVTIVKNWRGCELLDPVVMLPAYPGKAKDWLKEHERLGYPVRYKRPEIVRQP